LVPKCTSNGLGQNSARFTWPALQPTAHPASTPASPSPMRPPSALDGRRALEGAGGRGRPPAPSLPPTGEFRGCPKTKANWPIRGCPKAKANWPIRGCPKTKANWPIRGCPNPNWPPAVWVCPKIGVHSHPPTGQFGRVQNGPPTGGPGPSWSKYIVGQGRAVNPLQALPHPPRDIYIPLSAHDHSPSTGQHRVCPNQSHQLASLGCVQNPKRPGDQGEGVTLRAVATKAPQSTGESGFRTRARPPAPPSSPPAPAHLHRQLASGHAPRAPPIWAARPAPPPHRRPGWRACRHGGRARRRQRRGNPRTRPPSGLPLDPGRHACLSHCPPARYAAPDPPPQSTSSRAPLARWLLASLYTLRPHSGGKTVGNP